MRSTTKPSRVANAKEVQGYDPKPRPHVCQECACFQKDTEFSHEYLGKRYFKDKNLRCSIGEFAVKKTATCKQFRYS